MKRLALLMLILPVMAEGDASVSHAAGLLTINDGRGLRATISPEHGGELAGLEVRFRGQWQEIIYRARDYAPTDGWRGKAQTLWPAVGASLDAGGKGKGFRVRGDFYPMPGHGFARNYPWQLVRHGEDGQAAYAELTFASNEQTRVHYPFDFELRVEYRVASNRLVIVYTVSAGAENFGSMPFSIGNHVTFNAPLLGEGAATDVRFSNDLPDYLVRTEDRVFAGRVVPSPYRGVLPLSALPKRRSVGLGGPAGKSELTIIDPSGLSLLLRHEASLEPTQPVIRFNLWADTEEGFFSPEPWLGTQNALNSGAGLLRLDPGERWNWTIEIIPKGADEPVPPQTENAP
jgi:galactose mutarotase-like enzyme